MIGDFTYTITGSNVSNNLLTWSDNTYYPDNYPQVYWYTYPQKTVYKYQVICPRCSTTSWAEVDETITCTGSFKAGECGARIKVVLERVDYEVEVK
jgi:hypothetical protein